MKQQVEKLWFTNAGLIAVVLMTDMGHRCGYVGLTPQHPLYGVGYSERSPYLLAPYRRNTEKMGALQMLAGALLPFHQLNTPEYVLEVHGGLTYSGFGAGKYPIQSNKVWWLGYDCAHAGDAYAPDSLMSAYNFPDSIHRTLEFCIQECESLANQLAAIPTSRMQLWFRAGLFSAVALAMQIARPISIGIRRLRTRISR